MGASIVFVLMNCCHEPRVIKCEIFIMLQIIYLYTFLIRKRGH